MLGEVGGRPAGFQLLAMRSRNVVPGEQIREQWTVHFVEGA